MSNARGLEDGKFLPSLLPTKKSRGNSSSSHSEYLYRRDTAKKRNQSCSTQTGRRQGEGRLDMKLATKGGALSVFRGSVEEASLPVAHSVGKYL